MAPAALDASVVIASYNQLESTGLALRALFAQETRYTYEVIVCDDGSDARTISGFRKLLQGGADTWPPGMAAGQALPSRGQPQ